MKASDAIPDNIDHFEIAGQTIRKGSAAAFVQNAKTMSTILPAAVPSDLLQDQVELAEELAAVGFLDVFQLRSQVLIDVLIKANPKLKGIL